MRNCRLTCSLTLLCLAASASAQTEGPPAAAPAATDKPADRAASRPSRQALAAMRIELLARRLAVDLQLDAEQRAKVDALVAARRNGLSADEIKEVLLQAAIYCGVPAANSAFAVAQRALEDG